MIRSFLKKESKAQKLFQKRYPELSFLLKFSDQQKVKQVVLQVEKNSDFQTYLTPDVKTVIIFGLGSGQYFLKALKWLDASTSCEIVFVEKDLNHLKAFLKKSCAKKFFSHPRVHLRFVLEGSEIKEAIDEIASEFFSEKIKIFKDPSFCSESEFETLKEHYFRRSIIYSSLHQEALFREKLFENFMPNYKKLSKAKDLQSLKNAFEGVPVVICGAGPSLDENIKQIKALKGRAMVIAGGSAITALSKAGVEIDFAFAVDPNEEEYSRLKQSQGFTAPLIFASRVHPRVFDCFHGDLFYFKTCTGGPFESYLENIMEINSEPFHYGMKDEGLSVTVLCLSTAIALGFGPICLVGIDLAFVGKKRYAQGVVEDNDVFSSSESEHVIKKQNALGKDVFTTIKWVMESEVIADFVKAHPQITVYDGSKEGLGFEGIKTIEAEEFKNHCEKSSDLNALKHLKLLQARSLKPFEKPLHDALEKLKHSFLKCLDLTDQILTRASLIKRSEVESDPLISLYLIEFEEEIADLYFLKNLREMLNDLFFKKHRPQLNSQNYFEEKWKEVKLSIGSYLRLLDT